MKIGILGAGQLARMLAIAARPMGIQTVCFAPEFNHTVLNIVETYPGDEKNADDIKKFAEYVDVVTYETENINLALAQTLEKYVAVYPSSKVLACAQDRLLEKTLANDLGIATPHFADIQSLTDLTQAAQQFGFPCILKTRRFGYDGKGQYVLHTSNDIAKAWENLASRQACILESFVKFDREVSLIAVRDHQQNFKAYPLTENIHREGILRLSRAPFNDPALQQLAENYMQRIMDYFDYCGVLVIEFFQCGSQLVMNEMAPRVHNSGHWTIEGSITSQFANHVRAICHLPLGSTDSTGYHAMFNAIGIEPDIDAILQSPHAHFHTYEKIARPQRKLGHVTLSTHEQEIFNQEFSRIAQYFKI